MMGQATEYIPFKWDGEERGRIQDRLVSGCVI